MKTLRALWGIMRHEMLLQFKTKLFVLSLVNSIIVVLMWGYLAGLQAQPMDHLRVAVVGGTTHAKILNESENVNAIEYASIEEATAAVKDGDVVAAVLGPNNGRSLTILLDDSQGAAARAVLSAITASLLQALPAAPAANNSNAAIAAVEVKEIWGLGMDDPGYLLRLLGAGLVAMVVLSNAFVFGGFTLISEKTSGTIYFLALAPISRIWVIIGKLLANTLLILASTAITALMTIYLFGVSPTGSLALLFLAALLTGTGLLGLCYAISSFVRDERTFRVVAGLPLMMPMMLLSGIMYPIAVFPEWLQSVSRIFPVTWMVDISHAVFFKGAGMADVWHPLLLLAIFSIAMVFLGGIAVSRLMRIR
ncbi:MAG TPA: ABC transporter permease [Candidatus Limnocylindrales bacterium]|nr:ABC transporter permease [Candidatus Limnocylindrales bacterium]